MEEKNSTVPEVSVRDYVDMLRRRKAIVIQTFVVVFVVGAIVTFMSKPVYRTSTRILVEGDASEVSTMGSGDPLSGFGSREVRHDVLTQLEILQGSELMKKAYEEAHVPLGTVSLDVKQVNQTDVIELTTLSSVSQYATQFARTLPDTYKKFFTQNSSEELLNAIEFARKRLDEENSKLKEAQAKLNAERNLTKIYKTDIEQQNRLKDKDSADADVQRLRSAISAEEVRLAVMIAERRKLPDTVTTHLVAENKAADGLKQTVADLENEHARLLLRYSPMHPKVKDQEALIEDAKRRLAGAAILPPTDVKTRNPTAEEADKQISDMRGSLASDKALLLSAEEHSRAANKRLVDYGSGEGTQAKYEVDEAKARERITFLTRDIDNMLIRQKGEHNPVKIIAPAPDAAELAPKSYKNLLYPAIIGLVLGFCFALLQEFLDDRINSPEDARRLMDAPTLGYVPLVEAPEMRLLSQARKSGVHTSSFSLLESYRVLRSNVQFAAVDNPKNSLLVTSTTPGEGKSVTAANLAVALALDGKRVLLVDADLRRPTLHDKFGLPSRPGLTNVLVGQTALDDALQDTEVPGLRVLVAGPLPPNPAELLNSQAMRQLHMDLKDRADIVVYDSPPMLATADAQVLSASVDGVLYVVQFGEAKKSAVRHSMELLNQAHANILGVIFNKIDLTTKRDDYYYGYYAYYQYYQTEQLPGQKRRRRSTEEFEALLTKFNGNGNGNCNGNGNGHGNGNGNGNARLTNGLPMLPPQVQEARTEDKHKNSKKDKESV